MLLVGLGFPISGTVLSRIVVRYVVWVVICVVRLPLVTVTIVQIFVRRSIVSQPLSDMRRLAALRFALHGSVAKWIVQCEEEMFGRKLRDDDLFSHAEHKDQSQVWGQEARPATLSPSARDSGNLLATILDRLPVRRRVAHSNMLTSRLFVPFKSAYSQQCLRAFSSSQVNYKLKLSYDLYEAAKPESQNAPIVFIHGLFGSKKNNRSISK